MKESGTKRADQTIGLAFGKFFKSGTRFPPFPFQTRLALGDAQDEKGIACESMLVDVPTGLGKTEAVLMAWLWNRVHQRRSDWPRRLVYCLPMRVLVEQTRDRAVLILHRLGLLGGAAKVVEENGKERVENYVPSWKEKGKVAVTVLMGGEEKDEWDIHPERDAIIIGTQDMLLSRALNRGYALSRERWPMQFGLLHTDCLWVFDEIQLMGSGLATTSQLEAFRHRLGTKDGHACRSVWTSATSQRDWLQTVDFSPESLGEPRGLQQNDLENKEVQRRREANKPLARTKAVMGESIALAEEVVAAHGMFKGRTLIVVNTVSRARELCGAIKGLQAGVKTRKIDRRKKVVSQSVLHPDTRIVLLHSRFRRPDRKARVDDLLDDPPAEGTICVSTQVVEAGVDVSATTLFTEVAPWASLVQRFGRCNRSGSENDQARVFLIGPTAKLAEVARPYETEELAKALALLEKCKHGVGPSSLPHVDLPYRPTHVIRRRDLVDLFDTTPDLAGNDIDIDRFVRETENSDVRVFWRDWSQPKGNEPPPVDAQHPRPEELCAVPLGGKDSPGFRDFAKTHRGRAWRWNFLEKKWEEARPDKVVPGQVFLVHASAGGYVVERGWDVESKTRVEPIAVTERLHRSYLAVWQTIGEHAEDTHRQIDAILNALHLDGNEARVLRESARWHDRGKAHEVFQNAVDDGQIGPRKGKTVERRTRPVDWRGSREVAKFPYPVRRNGILVDPGWMRSYDWLPKEGRKHFRHELASALAVLDPRNGMIADESRDLIAYLVATHHGKVRLSIRSWPEERRPAPQSDRHGADRRFARGVWDGDELPATDLGGGVIAPAVTLSLEPMELGLCEREPFTGQPSWLERMIRLRDIHGPFRLAYLEALLRAADWRASAGPEKRAEVLTGGAAHA